MIFFEVNWKTSLLGAGWHLQAPVVSEEREFLFSKFFLLNTPHNLRESGALKKFNRLISSGSFPSWWDQTCGGYDPVDKVFMLHFPKNVWNIPWELLIQRLSSGKRREAVSFVRSTQYEYIENKSVFNEPLNTLILLGDSGESLGMPIDLEHEEERFMKAYDDLEISFKQCVKRPTVITASDKNLSEIIRCQRPHMLWFCGHGTANPQKAICLEGPSWISAKQFAESIQASGHIPLHAVFWACETGNVEQDKKIPSRQSIPSLYKELTSIGVVSVLAMQAPISDFGAQIMSGELLRYLAAGCSLELAVARIRASMIEMKSEDIHPLDWACPVVWSNGWVNSQISWNTPAHPIAQLQLLSRRMIRSVIKQGSEIDQPVNPEEQLFAKNLGSYRRIWLVSKNQIDNAELQFRWIRIVKALLNQTERGFITIDTYEGKKNPEAALKTWADLLIARLSKGDICEDLSKALYELKNGQITTGWMHLCQLGREKDCQFLLAIYGPPQYNPDDWFWKTVIEESEKYHLNVLILSDEPLDGNYRIARDWQLDKIEITMKEEDIKATIEEQPYLARTLAVLNTPIRTDYFEAAGLPFRSWTKRKQVIIDTSSGPILTASARQFILNQMTDEELRIAHQNCVKILGHWQIDLDEATREMRAEHCAKAGLKNEALFEISDLCFLYQQEDRPYAILSLIKRADINLIEYPSTTILTIAWAYMRLGKVTEAELYLDEPFLVENTLDRLNRAWKSSIKAEIYKSKGDKEGALVEINNAVSICEEAQKMATLEKQQAQLDLVTQRIWQYRQDRARIYQYLFYQKEKARLEYEALLKDKPQGIRQDFCIDVAIVQRNYAECLRTLARGVDDGLWLTSREVLAQAENNLRKYQRTPIYAEVLYEKAKLAEYEGKTIEALEYLNACERAAINSRHFMMAAIARSRIFWKTNNFSVAQWKSIISELNQYQDHGWAVRVMVDGRLRAAHLFEKAEDLTNGLNELQENLVILKRHPAFNQGSDQWRIAKTFAGLDTLEKKNCRFSSYWVDFQKDYDWAKNFLLQFSKVDANLIWNEVS